MCFSEFARQQGELNRRVPRWTIQPLRGRAKSDLSGHGVSCGLDDTFAMRISRNSDPSVLMITRVAAPNLLRCEIQFRKFAASRMLRRGGGGGGVTRTGTSAARTAIGPCGTDAVRAVGAGSTALG